MAARKNLAKSVRERGRVLSVFGPFNALTLVQIPTELALDVFPDGLAVAARPDLVAAVERELAEIRERSGATSDSALAATALVMAYEIQDPYNSATSKAMCAKAMAETMRDLRAACPPSEQEDRVDEIAKRRKRRLGVA